MSDDEDEERKTLDRLQVGAPSNAPKHRRHPVMIREVESATSIYVGPKSSDGLAPANQPGSLAGQEHTVRMSNQGVAAAVSAASPMQQHSLQSLDNTIPMNQQMLAAPLLEQAQRARTPSYVDQPAPQQPRQRTASYVEQPIAQPPQYAPPEQPRQRTASYVEQPIAQPPQYAPPEQPRQRMPSYIGQPAPQPVPVAQPIPQDPPAPPPQELTKSAPPSAMPGFVLGYLIICGVLTLLGLVMLGWLKMNHYF